MQTQKVSVGSILVSDFRAPPLLRSGAIPTDELRRLKCDRGHPCDQCGRRKQENLCQYASNSARGTTSFRKAAAPRDILTRIRYLEELVLSLHRDSSTERKRESTGTAETPSATPHPQSDNTTTEIPREEISVSDKSGIESPGTMITDQVGTRWVDATHWQAILDGVRYMTGFKIFQI